MCWKMSGDLCYFARRRLIVLRGALIHRLFLLKLFHLILEDIPPPNKKAKTSKFHHFFFQRSFFGSISSKDGRYSLDLIQVWQILVVTLPGVWCRSPISQVPQIFAFTVKKLERLGVSGVVIEDKPLGFFFRRKILLLMDEIRRPTTWWDV